MPDTTQLADAILNLTTYHREHEKFYALAPLQQAITLQRASLTLKTLADRWSVIKPKARESENPYAGCEDLNEALAIQQDGMLFLEGGGEPAEMEHLKRDLGTLANDFRGTGSWLTQAMNSSWESVRPLLRIPALADVLGERHRIIANDWQVAGMLELVACLIERAVEIAEQVTLTPAAVRADLSGPRNDPAYLYSAAELLDRAADIVSESTTLTHDNERRWRVFRQRVEQWTHAPAASQAAQHVVTADGAHA